MKIKFGFFSNFSSNMCSFNHKKLTLNFEIFISFGTFRLSIENNVKIQINDSISPFFSFRRHRFQKFFFLLLSSKSINLLKIEFSKKSNEIFSYPHHIYLGLNPDLPDRKIYIEMPMVSKNVEL